MIIKNGRSRSVSRILYGQPSRADRMTIPLGPTLPPGSSGLPVPPAPKEHESGPLSSSPPLESGDDGAGPIWPCSGWGLPSRHVTMPLVRSYRTISPLPTWPFGRYCNVGGVFSVALSVRSPSLGVTQHPALWSPDFPPVPTPFEVETGGHPTDFGHFYILYFSALHWKPQSVNLVRNLCMKEHEKIGAGDGER